MVSQDRSVSGYELQYARYKSASPHIIMIIITYNQMLETRDLTNNLHVMKEKWVRGHTLIDAGMIMTVFYRDSIHAFEYSYFHSKGNRARSL